jgi:hypothetical protein
MVQFEIAPGVSGFKPYFSERTSSKQKNLKNLPPDHAEDFPKNLPVE